MVDELIGILGLGTIGLKLVEYLTENGFSILAYNWRNISQKREYFLESIEKKIKFGKLSYELLDVMQNRIVFTGNLNDLANCTLVIDTLKESYDIKMAILRSLKEIVGQDTLVATSTSSLSIDRLASSFDPSRFAGMHFFNPPTRMKLIELAFLPQMPDSYRGRIYRFLGDLKDKKIVEIPPIQGYIVNRLLFIYINYAIEYKMDTGIDSMSIDEAMKLGTNAPMGPLELSDYIGNDVSLEILQELHTSLNDPRFKPATLLQDMVAAGKLGRKSKIGFYPY